MTSLPAIHKNRVSAAPKSPKHEERITSASVRAQRRQSRFMTLHDQELLKKDKIRKTQSTVDKVSTAQYRNSYFHNLCVGMLKEGFHRSFDEVFTLTENRRKEREEAGPDSVLWEETPLIEQFDKLDRLYVLLTKAEGALRNGKFEEVYSCRHSLAQFFLQSNDLWLSDHFFDSALETSFNIKLDGRRREAEAHCHVGLACERRGDIATAADHMQKFHEFTLGRAWVDEDDLNLHNLACRHLCRLHTLLGEAEQVKDKSRASLHLALDFSQEGEDLSQQANSAHKLGCAYETGNQSETAIQFLEQSLQLAKDLNDDFMIGQACRSLAKSHQTQGAMSRSVEYLELYAMTSRNCDMKKELMEASSCLGVIYNNMGHYDKAVDKFSDAYYQVSNADIEPQDGNSMPAAESCAMQLGVVMGNQMLSKFAGNMEIPKREMLERIAVWKDDRTIKFGDPLPTPIPPTPSSDQNFTPDPTQPFVEGEKLRANRLTS